LRRNEPWFWKGFSARKTRSSGMRRLSSRSSATRAASKRREESGITSSHDGNYKLKTEIIAAIDKYFFGQLLKQIDLKDTIICVTSDHSTPCILKVHSDTPVAVLIAGGNVVGDGRAVKFSEKNAAEGSLGTIQHGCELMPKLMELLKK
jgi:2,3-bisphosphoglycerate-independent phosphoglycerate mutase